MNSIIQDNASLLRLSIEKEAYLKISGDSQADFSLDRFDFLKLARTLIEYKDVVFDDITSEQKDFDEFKLSETLKEKLADQDELEDFCLKFAKRAFLAGKVKIDGIHKHTAELIKEMAPILDKIASGMDDIIGLKLLRDLHRRLLEYIEESNQTVIDPEINNQLRLRVTGANYWALNEQHKQLALLIKKIEINLLEQIDSNLIKKLKQRPIFSERELRRFSSEDQESIRKLVRFGLIHVSNIKGVGKIYAYPHGNIKREHFEKCIPKDKREIIGSLIKIELEKKYSGKVRPLGIAKIRSEGVPTLLDTMRVRDIARKSRLESGHIILALKYYASYGLLEENNGGFSLSRIGKGVGLGFKAIRLVNRITNSKQPSVIRSMFEHYLEEAIRAVDSWQVPSYVVSSKEGGIPKTYIIDQVLFPTAKIDTNMLKFAISKVREDKKSLIIAGNLLQGPPEIDRKKIRTQVSGYSELSEQINLVSDFFNQFEDSSVMHILGPIMDLTAERRAYQQALRERNVARQLNKPNEASIRDQISQKNTQKQHTEQQDLAVEIADWTSFISRVIHPFEIKIGRMLLESSDIYKATGIDMNELEIVRDLSALIIKCGSLSDALNQINANYKDFLEYVTMLDPNYLIKLEKVIFSEKEIISEHEIVSRAGSVVVFYTDEGKKGLSMKIVPDHAFGKRPKRHPTESYKAYLHSRANLGQAIEDIHIIMNTGESIAELTNLGVWIISGGSFLSSARNTNDLFYDIHQDEDKRNRTVFGMPAQTGFFSIEGGVNDGICTQALTIQAYTPKLLEVIENNKVRNLPAKSAKIYVTSDWQIGSPTMQPEMILAGMIEAINQGVVEILINGDIRQGMNYLRYPQEAQLVEYPLNGLDSQGAYIYELINPVLKYIRAKKEIEPNFKIPKFRILPGNHESNSQANKGLQGTWFVKDIAEKIKSYLEGWLNDEELAKSLVVCPEKFISHDKTPVDYPMAVLDYSEDFGIRIQATHYNASGAKGSKFSPTVAGVAQAVHSLAIEEPHIRIESHMHVTGLMIRNGIVCVRTGANATGSGFEEHLLYSNAPESNMFIELNSRDVPKFFIATRSYLKTRYNDLIAQLHQLGILIGYDSFEEYCFDKRRIVSLKQNGNPTDLSKITVGFPHDARERNRVLR
jgi:hypothetical protein